MEDTSFKVNSSKPAYNNNLEASPKISKKPKQSVKVVMMMEEATAGSIPTLFSNNGIVLC